MIRLEQFSFSYPNGPQVIADISLQITPGKITVLMGPSGCGKSTILRALMGLEQGGTGILVTGFGRQDLAQWNSAQSTFALVPQTPLLFPWKTVSDNIGLAVPPRYSKSEKTNLVEQILATVQLSDAAKKYPGEISQGMASRVAFARTLVMDADAILFDEPFAALDAMTRSHLQKWTQEKIRETKKAVLFVTHDKEEAQKLGDQILHLDGKPARIINKA